jgi:hypothetical protein
MLAQSIKQGHLQICLGFNGLHGKLAMSRFVEEMIYYGIGMILESLLCCFRRSGLDRRSHGYAIKKCDQELVFDRRASYRLDGGSMCEERSSTHFENTITFCCLTNRANVDPI